MYFQLSICLVSPEVQHQEQLEHIESVIYFAYGSSRPPEIISCYPIIFQKSHEFQCHDEAL